MNEQTQPLFCANHPKIETILRCNRCEKPICPKCAIATPTGYRCKECVRGQQKIFDTTRWYDYLTACSAAVILSFIGSRIAPSLGFFTILLSPIAGVIIAEICRVILQRRRSKKLYQAIMAAVAIGSLPMLLFYLITALVMLPNGGLGMLWQVLLQAIYTFLVTTSAYYRLSGINISV